MESIQTAVLDLLSLLSDWITPYLYQLIVAWVATILVVFGDDLLRWLKKQTGHLRFLWRLFIFVFFSAFGFTALTQFGVPFTAKLLEQVPEIWLFPTVLVAFIAIGLIAKKRGLL